MSKHVRVQDLVGQTVRDAGGKELGRIQSIRAAWRGDQCLVLDFELGASAWLKRVGISAAGLIGLPLKRPEPRRIPWDKLDLSDPERPVVRD